MEEHNILPLFVERQEKGQGINISKPSQRVFLHQKSSHQYYRKCSPYMAFLAVRIYIYQSPILVFSDFVSV